MNKYIILYRSSFIQGYTPLVSLEQALEDAYLHAIQMPPVDEYGWPIFTSTIIYSPFSYE